MSEPTVDIIVGDCLESLKGMADQSVNCCVTSPPYFGLRDYGHNGQIGLEPTPDEFVAALVSVFREVRRVLKDDGTLWLNLGDSYGKGKHLLGMPWRAAFALQSDGWIIRQDIIWNKPNPMPESVRDRCTKSHEYIFLLSKSAKYHYDAEAIKEPVALSTISRLSQSGLSGQLGSARVPGKTNGSMKAVGNRETRNRRSVWTVTTQPFKGAHFATFPPALIEPCILAGCPAGGTVLDPFGGACTTGMVAAMHGRKAIMLELNPEYAAMGRARIDAALEAEAERTAPSPQLELMTLEA
jgi:DNA modification methylase